MATQNADEVEKYGADEETKKQRKAWRSDFEERLDRAEADIRAIKARMKELGL